MNLRSTNLSNTTYSPMLICVVTRPSPLSMSTYDSTCRPEVGGEEVVVGEGSEEDEGDTEADSVVEVADMVATDM